MRHKHLVGPLLVVTGLIVVGFLARDPPARGSDCGAAKLLLDLATVTEDGVRQPVAGEPRRNIYLSGRESGAVELSAYLQDGGYWTERYDVVSMAACP